MVFESVVGLPAAHKLSTLRQEEASRLERPVQEALGRLLAEPGRGHVQSSHTFHLLVAQAVKASGGDSKGCSTPDREPGPTTVERVVARILRFGNAFLEQAGIPYRMALVPAGAPTTPGGSAETRPERTSASGTPQGGEEMGCGRTGSRPDEGGQEWILPPILRNFLVSPA